MKPNPLLVAAALLYSIPGLALTFASRETLGAIGIPPSLLTDWLAQLLGAALLGLALLNWIQRHTLVAGIFGRPLLMTNLLFTTAAFFATLRTWRQSESTVLLGATVALGALAALFGSRLFTPSPRAATNPPGGAD
jgi:hypothetical protein